MLCTAFLLLYALLMPVLLRKQAATGLFTVLLLSAAFCTAESNPLTPDQVIAVIRSQPQCKADSDLKIVREFPATEDGAKLARLAARTARKKHLRQFRSGILVRLLNNGGYLVMESNSQTMRPLRLYYLSRAVDGRQLIDVVEIQKTDGSTDYTANDVQLVMQHTQVFMGELLTAQSYELSELVEHYFGQIPAFDENEGPETYFAIPANVLGFGTQREIEDLSALASAVHLWTFRHALSMPEFAANPHEALQTAYEERTKLLDEFRIMKNIGQKDSCVVWPGPVRTPETLKQCLELLRQVNAFFDRQAGPVESRWIFDLNLTLAGLPFDLGTTRETGFGLAVVPGLIPTWVRHANGEFKLIELSEDE